MGVVILLSIIALIALTVVNKNINKVQTILYNTQITNITNGAKNWSTDNIKALPDEGEVYLTLAQLKQGGYVEDNVKSPADDKKCFPNNLEVKITITESGNYKYSVVNDRKDIEFISCDNDELDLNSPGIVLAKNENSTVNKSNEVVDYVEVDKNNDSGYQVLGHIFYNHEGKKINKSEYKDYDINITINGEEVTDEQIKVNIQNYGVTYKIVYSITENEKTVSAVRNVIVQDTTAPVITINKTEDAILYYNDSGVQIIDYVFTSANVTDNSSSTACVQGNSGACYYKLDGIEKINTYFNSDEFKAIPQSDYANFSKEFPVIIIAIDEAGNTDKRTQNIKFTLNEVKAPALKLIDASYNVLYDSSDETISIEDKWYDNNKFAVKVESGCAIDYTNSYYKYNGNTIYFNTLSLSSKFDISFGITLEEGQKDLEIHATCGSDVDKTLFPVSEVNMPTTTIKVDLNDPVCNIDVTGGTYNSSTGWYTTKPTVTYELSDTNGVTGTFNNNGTTNTITSTTNYSQSIEVTSDGSYKYTLEGTDAAGKNCNSSKTVNVDSTAPVITFIRQNVYPTRKKFVSKIYGSSNVCFQQFAVYTNGTTIVPIGNVSSIDILHCSSQSNGNGKSVYSTTAATSCSGYNGSSSYTGKGVNMTACNGGGNTYVRDSGISINLSQAYAVYKWHIKLTAGKYFKDFCSYDDSKQNYSVSNYKKKDDYCSNSNFITAISNGTIFETKSGGFASVPKSGDTTSTTADFIEKPVTNLSIVYSDVSGIKSNGITSVREISSNIKLSATDIAGNTATCIYNYSGSTCSCTIGTCAIN